MLALLQDGRGSPTANEVATSLGLHPNTARFHLEALAEAGLVVREREDRSAPGRPKVHYVPASDAPLAGDRNYRLLAEILTAHLSATAADPEAAAADAGRTFGRLAARERSGATAAGAGSRTEATGAVVDTLDAMGFDSSVTPEPAGVRLDVHRCPFLELAHAPAEAGGLSVVCAVHRGLMEGLLDETGSQLRVASLEPLVAPGHCIARLVRQSPAVGTRRAAASR